MTTIPIVSQVRVELRGRIQEEFTSGVLNQAAKFAAQTYLRVIIQRTLQGVSSTGGKFQKLKREYEDGKRIRLRQARARGRYAAAAAGDILRMRGTLLRGLQVTNARGSIGSAGELVATFDIGFRDPKFAKIAEGLSTGQLGKTKRPARPFVGLCPPTSSRGRAERREVVGAFTSYLATNSRIRGIIIER